jgi:glycosyltransferase involved in cell wall biosynthesis
LTEKKQNITELQVVKERFRQQGICAIIPTYNNEKTVKSVIKGVKEYIDDVIVINDGSTDSTNEIIKAISGIDAIGYKKNQGKGFALRTAFKHAIDKGFDYAITIDSDGQHMPEDLLVFLEKIEQAPGSLIVGARNMDQDSVPGKSSFGHRFSNFWFRFETGIKLPDTQSGYRLYPIKFYRKSKFYTKKYEFEIEVLVRSAWSGIKISSVPIKVHYGDDRVTHFRPFKDFSRVSVLNTVLVFLMLLYVKPFNFINELRRNSFKDFWQKYIVNNEESNAKITYAVMFGLFMGVAPIWGWQLIVGLAFAHILKLNKVIFVLAAHISVPPMIPLIIYVSYVLGGVILPGATTALPSLSHIDLSFIFENLFQYILGSLVLGVLLAIIIGPVVFFILQLTRKSKDLL